jgi:hypothetical protein
MLVYIIQWCIQVLRKIYRRRQRSTIRHSNSALFLKSNKEFRRKLNRQSLSRTDEPEQGGYEPLRKSQWKNDYPIVLVHGFGGFTADESPLFGNYWRMADNPNIRAFN